jgi:hypothetical protein
MRTIDLAKQPLAGATQAPAGGVNHLTGKSLKVTVELNPADLLRLEDMRPWRLDHYAVAPAE